MENKPNLMYVSIYGCLVEHLKNGEIMNQSFKNHLLPVQRFAQKFTFKTKIKFINF